MEFWPEIARILMLAVSGKALPLGNSRVGVQAQIELRVRPQDWKRERRFSASASWTALTWCLLLVLNSMKAHSFQSYLVEASYSSLNDIEK